MTQDFEPQPRAMGGRYLRNIPGLTPQRLGELYQSIMHVTADRTAMADVTYFAAGGMRIEVHWTQNGMRQHYPATLTAAQVAAVLHTDEDTLFTQFATETLESVRQLHNQLAEAEPMAEQPADFTPQASAMDTLIGSIRAAAARPVDLFGAVPECSVCGHALTQEHKRDCNILDCPHSSPPADSGTTEEP